MSLEQELESEQVSHLDLSGVSQVASGVTVKEALGVMQENGRNVCLITEHDRLVGILTDRDVLTKIVTQPAILSSPVNELMTPNPVTVKPDTSAKDALSLMHEKHIRNLPVVKEDGTIVGGMTYESVISFLAARYPVEVLNRPPRPGQFPRKQEGGD